ncbi:MAG: N-acetyl sugar amidotransferase [Methanocorpusculum sp.]|nr:N-acetyl sugar amidotransferase [Oscillospiraceae bacterium]MBQ3569664.1 N-acetyl sugar amidotransferase [Methanocorpusculum sp.]
MDNSSDETITFDEHGYCNYCSEALAKKDRCYFPNEDGKKRLDDIIDKIKKDGVDKKYDCMMGISGGLDSSYLAYLGYTWGLRILAIHVDDGFDTDISKSNIKKLVDTAGIDLIIIKPDQQQFNALTKAYMKAGVPNLAVPQDNVLFAALYRYARENGIKYFLSGTNYALESILQRGNTHSAYDVVNILAINKIFGTENIDKLSFISEYRRVLDKFILGLQTICPLDYIDYNRDRAFQELNEFCGFEYYGRKHLENMLTAFIQLIWFPQKFGVDKRTSHLSSMIVSGQMTRDEALAELEHPIVDDNTPYIKFILERLDLDEKELANYLASEGRDHKYYQYDVFYDTVFRIIRSLKYTMLKLLNAF